MKNITINCEFISNNGSNGGALHFPNFGNAYINPEEIMVSIENSIFIGNTAEKGAAIFSIAIIALNNSVFIDNHANLGGGAILSYNETQITNCLFMNNSAKNGGNVNLNWETNIINSTFTNSIAENGPAIYAQAEISIEDSIFENLVGSTNGAIVSEKYMEITNCIFMNNTGTWGASIYSKGTLNIRNSSFSNSKSKYASAIYAEGNITVSDSIFENMYANETAGAVGLRDMDIIKIINCTFINSEARKNGGAIYIDINRNPNTTTSIVKSTFINSTGDFGGALVQLGGILIIENSTFTENTAIYAGSAVFISNGMMGIGNCSFESNRILYKEIYGGGTLYCDKTYFLSIYLTFKDNDGNAIYGYDANLTINDSEFERNGEAIHCVFCQVILNDNVYNDDILILNDTDYASVMMSSGMKLELINNTIDVNDLPARFDLRDWGWVSSVKNQGDMGSCWTFGSCGALESALIKATGIEYDFSENNMQDNPLAFSKYGISGVNEGGWQEFALEYILSWFGPFPTEYDSYDELGKLSPVILTDENIHIQDAILVKQRANFTDNDAFKKALIKYGSIHITYDPYGDAPYYNENTFAQYQNISTEQAHAISLVGWDDNFSASNFLITPPGDGAWIIKNNWGDDWGDNGYDYISYYDTSILAYIHNVGFVIENTEDYTANYQTDLSGYLGILEYDYNISYKITYTSFRNELISAVGTYFADEGEEYLLEIYVNDDLKHTQSGTAPFRGFHTVKLTDEIPIKEWDNFTAVMKKQSIPILSMSRQHHIENISFYDLGDGWKDISLENEAISLKVYTKDLSIYTEDLIKFYKNDSQFEANISIANEKVTFEINGVNYTRTSNENGTAKMTINLGPGSYTIKTTFNGTTVENTITVLPTLIAENLVKYYRNASQFYVSLIDGKENPVSGVNITMNINGVFYDRLTNENGTAKLNINLEPGEYILTAIDPVTGLMMSYNITVLPVLSAENMEMKYLDGSTFNATVIDGKGNPLADASVTFNINGVFYNRTTDENGIARLNIRLMAGEYIITSEYNEMRIANTITIKD